MINLDFDSNYSEVCRHSRIVATKSRRMWPVTMQMHSTINAQAASTLLIHHDEVIVLALVFVLPSEDNDKN